MLRRKRKNILKDLIGKELIKIRHDPFDKFGQETVYGKVELFFKDQIVLIDYDYVTYPLFGNDEDDHPKFSIKLISEGQAISALEDTAQINISCKRIVKNVVLVEDYIEVEWDNKKDSLRILKSIIFQFENGEIAFQGDYMMPLIDIYKGDNLKDKLVSPGDEFDNDPETKFKAKRYFVELK